MRAARAMAAVSTMTVATTREVARAVVAAMVMATAMARAVRVWLW